MNYTWSIDETQADDLQVTIMIHDGDVDKLTSRFIGEFTMFFKDGDEIWQFIEDGMTEFYEHKEVMDHLRGLATR